MQLDATLTETLQELRDVCQGIHPRVLSRGLMPALKLLSNRSELPTELDLRVGDAFHPQSRQPLISWWRKRFRTPPNMRTLRSCGSAARYGRIASRLRCATTA